MVIQQPVQIEISIFIFIFLTSINIKVMNRTNTNNIEQFRSSVVAVKKVQETARANAVSMPLTLHSPE